VSPRAEDPELDEERPPVTPVADADAEDESDDESEDDDEEEGDEPEEEAKAAAAAPPAPKRAVVARPAPRVPAVVPADAAQRRVDLAAYAAIWALILGAAATLMVRGG
jgi:hypothetical protein